MWCWRRLLRVPWTARRSNQSILKEISPEYSGLKISPERTDAEAEAPILWPPDVKNWLVRKDPDAGTDWRQEEKGTTEDEMVGWHHRPNGREFEWTPGVGDGQGGLECCSPWGRKESDTTEWVDWGDWHSWPSFLYMGKSLHSYIGDLISPPPLELFLSSFPCFLFFGFTCMFSWVLH